MIAYDLKTKRLCQPPEGHGEPHRYLSWAAMSKRQRMITVDSMLPRSRELADYINGSTTNRVRALKHGMCLMVDGGVPLNVGALRLLMQDCEWERLWRTR